MRTLSRTSKLLGGALLAATCTLTAACGSGGAGDASTPSQESSNTLVDGGALSDVASRLTQLCLAQPHTWSGPIVHVEDGTIEFDQIAAASDDEVHAQAVTTVAQELAGTDALVTDRWTGAAPADRILVVVGQSDAVVDCQGAVVDR